MKYKLGEKDIYNHSYFILDAIAREYNTNLNSKYRIFYRKRKTCFFDSESGKVYFIKGCYFRVFCFDDDQEYVYALRQYIYKNKKEQRTINCYHIPSGELVEQYEIDKSVLKGYKNYTFYYMDLFDNRIIIVFYHQVFDGLKFEALVYDLLTGSGFIIPIHNELKFDHSLTVDRKPYFIFNNLIYFDLIDNQNRHAIYHLDNQGKLVHKKDLNSRLNIFNVFNHNNMPYILYDEENNLANIYLYDSSSTYIDSFKLEKCNDDAYVSSSDFEVYMDTDLKKLYVFFRDKEFLSILYVYNLIDKKKIEIEFDSGIYFVSMLNYNKLLVKCNKIDTRNSKKDKKPNYLVNFKYNNYRLVNLASILDEINTSL